MLLSTNQKVLYPSEKVTIDTSYMCTICCHTHPKSLSIKAISIINFNVSHHYTQNGDQGIEGNQVIMNQNRQIATKFSTHSLLQV